MRFLVSLFLISGVLFAEALNFHSIQSDFIQTVTSPEGSVLEYKGTFYAKDTNHALWVYETPVAKKIYFTPKQVIIVEPELEQAIVTTLKETPNLSTMLSRAKEVTPELFTATYQDSIYKLTVKNGVPLSILYLDKLDNEVRITLSNTHTNLILDDVLFKLELPDFYDIIHQ